ncbi:tRNA (Uracil(54)-C(5))-methyltransferase [Tolypocladium paradoxum]|uniref:tRNA (Uracil(54)-C(5))-methyltransferase n=1 Tax=Tolypocladium paradoxum TaxID=94208 RepID=A0A2S4L2K5_9HYPO|nr:tRNA (Uracil(54)-C(5))-methyltransferase [Tolypocladium paradoxum]
MRPWRLLSARPLLTPAPSATVRRPLATMASTQAPAHGNGAPKRPNPGNKRAWKQKKTKREKNITEGSSEEVLRYDILALLESRRSEPGTDAADEGTNDDEPLPEEGTETEVEVLELASTGDGLAMRPGSSHVYVVPFTVPGDTARVNVFRHLRHEHHSVADFISITKPSPLRDDARVRCRYFASCGGCQFQMLEYPEQLRLKRRVLDKAYRNFANLPAELVPAVGDTIGSPLQYGYRTKLTPHFDGPPGFRPSKRGRNPKVPFASCPDIGFMQRGKRKVLDIEDCPIGTTAVRLGMARERERMQREFNKYERGATILLRENTRRYLDGDGQEEAPPKDGDPLPPYTARSEGDGFVDVKSCETDSKATTTEYYLIDAYSGSGLFTITLASVFQHSTGIDIAADSIASARRNAALNGLGEDRCKFIAADAGQLFRNVAYAPDETVVVLDPPRKGCDADFLAQLRRFGPRRVLYVSCNVHTQARDVGVLVRGEGEGARYHLESLVGFDFFPQTGHVEGVAVLNRHESETDCKADAAEQKDS